MNKNYSLDGVQAILAYPFKQEGWQSKFAIGVALFFANYIVPILPGIFLAGYFAKMMHSVITEDVDELSMPAWEDWGDLFKRGLKVFCATFIYMFPALFLMIGGYLMMYIPIILESISSHSRASDLSTGIIIGMCVGFAMFFLGLVLYMPTMIILPPAITHLIAKDSFAAAFRIREWVAILRANFWGFFAAFTVVAGAYLVLFMAVYALYFTIILACLMPIGLSLIAVYLAVISAPLLGQAYRKGVDNLAVASASDLS
jgi:hypothetical protein